jgi:hypothetical protein
LLNSPAGWICVNDDRDGRGRLNHNALGHQGHYLISIGKMPTILVYSGETFRLPLMVTAPAMILIPNPSQR